MEWHPIETAPKDGTILLGWEDECVLMHYVVFEKQVNAWEGWMTVEGESWSCNPTHWMPLPEPPKCK